MTNTQSSISGTVRDPNGQPVSDARVYFIEGPVPFPDVALLTDSNGAFTLTAPAPGTYMIGCTANGFEPIIVTVNVSKSQNVQVEIKLAK